MLSTNFIWERLYCLEPAKLCSNSSELELSEQPGTWAVVVAKVLDRKDEKIQVCQSSQNLSGFPLSDLFTDFLRENERKTLSFCRNGDFCSNGFVMVFLLSELPAGREKRRTKALQWLSFISPFKGPFLVCTSLVRETLIFATKQ